MPSHMAEWQWILREIVDVKHKTMTEQEGQENLDRISELFNEHELTLGDAFRVLSSMFISLTNDVQKRYPKENVIGEAVKYLNIIRYNVLPPKDRPN